MGPRVADVYSVGLQLGFATLTGFVIGIVYSLAIGRPYFRHASVCSWIALILSVVLGSATAAQLLRTVANLDTSLTIQVCLAFSAGGAALAATGVRAVLLACKGNPIPLASVAIASNTVFSLAVILAGLLKDHLSITLSAFPAWAWLVATLAQYLWALRRVSLAPSSEYPEAEKDAYSLHTIALTIGSITATIVPIFLSTSAARLAAGTAALLYISTRIVNSTVNLGVNSFLMVRYNWLTMGGPFPLGTIATRLTGAACFLVASDVMISFLHLSIYIGFGICVTAFALSVAPAAIYSREVNQRRLGRVLLAKAILDLALAGGFTVVFYRHPSILGFFAVYIISQGVTIAAASYGLRRPRDVILAATLTLGALALVLSG